MDLQQVGASDSTAIEIKLDNGEVIPVMLTPTSAVDTATEASIKEALASLKGTTKIIIAQRISSLQHANQIIILDNGKIHAIGNHEELLKNDEIYQEIYDSQLKGVDL